MKSSQFPLGTALTLLAVCLPSWLPAQEAPSAPAPVAAAPQPASAEEEAGLGSDEKMPFVDYADTDVRTVISEVAETYQLNIAVPDTLQGQTTIRLRNVTWREVFDLVLGQVDYTYIQQGNIIRIVSRASLGTEPVSTEVITLEFAKVSDIAAILTPMLTLPGERVQIDARTNSLILTVGQSRGTEIKSIITRLDQEPGDARQVLIETKFIEANVSDVKNVGMNWTSLSNYGLTAGPVTRTYSRELTQSQQQVGSSPFDRLTDVSITRGTAAVFSADEFNVILSALKTANNVRLMSNPTVVSLTNEEARINVTTKFPIILTTSTPGASGTQITETKQDEEYGISLRVVPQIRPKGLISMTITPEVSNLDGFNTGASGNRYPIISRRTVTNRVNLRDGYTIALGGLVTSQVSKGSSKVPVLGDLPGLGGLFRSKSNTAESRNLIVFITARVIDPSGNLGTPASQENFDSMLKETVDPRMIRDLQVERFDLPGYKPDLPTFPTGEGSETSESAKKSDESEATVRTYQK